MLPLLMNLGMFGVPASAGGNRVFKRNKQRVRRLKYSDLEARKKLDEGRTKTIIIEPENPLNEIYEDDEDEIVIAAVTRLLH